VGLIADVPSTSRTGEIGDFFRDDCRIDTDVIDRLLIDWIWSAWLIERALERVELEARLGAGRAVLLEERNDVGRVEVSANVVGDCWDELVDISCKIAPRAHLRQTADDLLLTSNSPDVGIVASPEPGI
jgi:hypothetical protein